MQDYPLALCVAEDEDLVAGDGFLFAVDDLFGLEADYALEYHLQALQELLGGKGDEQKVEDLLVGEEGVARRGLPHQLENVG